MASHLSQNKLLWGLLRTVLHHSDLGSPCRPSPTTPHYSPAALAPVHAISLGELEEKGDMQGGAWSETLGESCQTCRNHLGRRFMVKKSQERV